MDMKDSFIIACKYISSTQCNYGSNADQASRNMPYDPEYISKFYIFQYFHFQNNSYFRVLSSIAHMSIAVTVAGAVPHRSKNQYIDRVLQ